MQIHFKKSADLDAVKLVRRSGYGQLFNRREGEYSYVRRLHGDLYPRFHVYIKEEGDGFIFNMHLDQRAPVYAGVTAHAGEYDGDTVEREAERIRQVARMLTGESDPKSSDSFEPPAPPLQYG